MVPINNKNEPKDLRLNKNVSKMIIKNAKIIISFTSFPFQPNHITISKKKRRNLCDICLCHIKSQFTYKDLALVILSCIIFLMKKISTEELKRLEVKQIERYKLFFRFMNKEITEPIFKID